MPEIIAVTLRHRIMVMGWSRTEIRWLNESDPKLEGQLETASWQTETETDGQNRKEPSGNRRTERGGISSG